MLSMLIPEDGFSIFLILQALSVVGFIALIIFGPKIMMWQVNRRIRDTMIDLENYKNTTETKFLNKLTDQPTEQLKNRFNTLKDFKVSQPANLDPAGLVNKIEHVLDNSEDKFQRFIDQYADTQIEHEKQDLKMAFKGVMGTNQIHKTMKHFQKLLNKTGNLQLIGMIQMMLPIYKELAEAQKDATRAFLDQAPIGDSIGPLVAARLIQNDEEELEEIAENIIHSQEQIEDQEIHILKTNGPGARLGKYGQAIENLTEETDLEAIITVDAAAKLESEETGTISEGVGVMMGGPGVQKTRIEDTATQNQIPLEGIVIKQSAPEASKPMKKQIYQSYEEAEKQTRQLAKQFQGPVAIIGVGNTVGIPNTRKQTQTVHNKLHKYWKEYEQQDEDEVSYTGLMQMIGGGHNQISQNNFKQKISTLLWRNPIIEK